jgi:heme-degrading monooxygenase HmoA
VPFIVGAKVDYDCTSLARLDQDTRRGSLRETAQEQSAALLKVRPSLKRVDGHKGGYVFRKDAADEVEFVAVNLFDSLEAVQRFAGPDYTVPVFEPEAKRLLSRIESFAAHYEVRVNTVPKQ